MGGGAGLPVRLVEGRDLQVDGCVARLVGRGEVRPHPDDLDAAGLLALGRQARAGAAADDRLTAPGHVLELLEELGPREPSGHFCTSRHASTNASANSGSVSTSGRPSSPRNNVVC